MKTYTADQIADYFLARSATVPEESISNLKLQKLCYYAQGLAVAVRGRPFFDESLEAWTHGPVVPHLYHKFKAYGSGEIPAPRVDLASFDQADLIILNDVANYYGQYSAWRLRQMTHEESPWKNNKDGNQIISVEDLRAHFNDEVTDEYRARYVEVSSARA